MFSENTQNDFPVNENGFCLSCGWCSDFPNSHIEYCGGGGCEYIRNKYVVWTNEDGELKWKEKDSLVQKKIVRRRRVYKEPIIYEFNPIEIMKKLPMDINIYINEFLYNKNGYNEGLVKAFNRDVLYEETLIKKLNKIYFKMLHKTHEYNEMNDYEYAIRRALAGDEVYYASSIRFEDYETDDGRPMGILELESDSGTYYIEIEDEDELVDKYENNESINNGELLVKIDAEILYKYLYDNLMSYNKDCCPEAQQIVALQSCRSNHAYEVLKNYIYMMGSERQFYEWYVNYFTRDAFEMFYGDDDNDDYNTMSLHDIKKVNLGWKETWIVIFN